MRLFINGSPSGGSRPIADPFNLETVGSGFHGINGNNPLDPSVSGSTDDFRIYVGNLDPRQVAALFALGPDATNEAVVLASGNGVIQRDPSLAAVVQKTNAGTTTYQLSADSDDLFPAGSKVGASGINIDTQQYNASINSILSHDEGLGAAADGGLSKLGSGSLSLGGANTSIGKTTASGGTLIIDNAIGSAVTWPAR